VGRDQPQADHHQHHWAHRQESSHLRHQHPVTTGRMLIYRKQSAKLGTTSKSMRGAAGGIFLNEVCSFSYIPN
jgi:hypothetical protein